MPIDGGIMEKTNNRTWCDRFDHEMLEHLKKYLNIFGITCDEQTGTYYCGDDMLTVDYFEENMPVSSGSCEDNLWDDVLFYSSKHGGVIAEIMENGTVLFHGKDSFGPIRRIKYTNENNVCQIEYITGLRKKYPYCLAISHDVFGNIMIAFGSIDTVHINIGSLTGEAKDYLEELKTKIKTVLANDEMWPMVELLFDDPRIVKKVNELIQNMAPNIDEAFERKASELYRAYTKALEKLSDNYHRDFSILEDRRDECKRRNEGNKK